MPNYITGKKLSRETVNNDVGEVEGDDRLPFGIRLREAPKLVYSDTRGYLGYVAIAAIGQLLRPRLCQPEITQITLRP